MKILALGANSTKFYIHNLWATRRVEMQKLGAGMERGGERFENGLWAGVGGEDRRRRASQLV